MFVVGMEFTNKKAISKLSVSLSGEWALFRRMKITRLGGLPALPHGSRPLPLQLLGLLLALSQDLGVLSSGLAVLLGPPALQSHAVTLPLQHGRGDQPLDLGGLVPLLLALLEGQRPLDDILTHVILLGEVKQLPDLGSPLGTEPPRDGVVGKSGNLLLSLLNDSHGDDGEVAVDNAATNRLAPALSLPTLAVARVTLAQKQANTALSEDTLLHGKTLEKQHEIDTKLIYHL